MKAAFALPALAPLAACLAPAAPETVATPPDMEGPVSLGQIAYVNGPRVRPDLVIEDSRCPADRQCVWAGRVVLRARVIGGSWSQEIDLVLGVPVAVADGILTLVSAEPAPANGQVPPQRLRFTFDFQGGL